MRTRRIKRQSACKALISLSAQLDGLLSLSPGRTLARGAVIARARRGARAPSLTRSAADLVFLHCRRGEDGAVTHARGGSGAGFNSPMSLRVATSKRVTWGTFRERGLQRIAEVAGIPGGVRAVLEQIACAVREDATPTLFVNAAARDVARELLRHHAIASSGTTVAAPLPRNAPPPPFHPMTPAPVSEPRSRPHRERSCDRGAPSPALAVCSAPADRPIRFASPYRPRQPTHPRPRPRRKDAPCVLPRPTAPRGDESDILGRSCAGRADHPTQVKSSRRPLRSPSLLLRSRCSVSTRFQMRRRSRAKRTSEHASASTTTMAQRFQHLTMR